jgi:hypothetical protein
LLGECQHDGLGKARDVELVRATVRRLYSEDVAVDPDAVRFKQVERYGPEPVVSSYKQAAIGEQQVAARADELLALGCEPFDRLADDVDRSAVVR